MIAIPWDPVRALSRFDSRYFDEYDIYDGRIGNHKLKILT